MAGPLSEWPHHLERSRDMGFDHVACAPLFAPGASADIFLTGDHDAPHPALGLGKGVDEVFSAVAAMCRQHGAEFVCDIVLDRVAADSRLARARPDLFSSHSLAAIDPRVEMPRADAVYARFDEPAAAGLLAEWWIERLVRLAHAGVAGFRCLRPSATPTHVWREIVRGVQERAQGCRFLAWTPGLSWLEIEELRNVGFDGAFSSLPWWDEHASWFVEEGELLRQIGAVIPCPEPPFGIRLARRLAPGTDLSAHYGHHLDVAASVGNGLMVPMGFEFALGRDMDPRHSTPADLNERQGEINVSAHVRMANDRAAKLAALGISGETRPLTSAGNAVTALLRCNAPDARQASAAAVVLMNTDLRTARRSPVGLDPLPPAAGASYTATSSIGTTEDPNAELKRGEVRLIAARRNGGIAAEPIDNLAKLLRPAARIVIDNVTPAVDGGHFATKCVVGDAVVISADVFTDGHGVLAVELLWQAADEQDWLRQPMLLLGNDRWQATIRPARVGRHCFRIEAWPDEYGTFCRDIEVKRKAGVDIALDIEEGRLLLQDAVKRARGGMRGVLTDALERTAATGVDSSFDILLSAEIREAMASCEDRRLRARLPTVFPLEAERPQARFAAWYELFPRSATNEPTRHGTFDDVIARLPDIRDMGFDVLYFPPIHPIGVTNRKGRNNALRANEGDLGSPYAIGGLEGGHDAVHPALGTLADFRRLLEAAAAEGIEIALDFAIQCSPDHPWVKQHADWFRWRPDGSMHYAENPPKRYEDIVNVDFYAKGAASELWRALRDIVQFWVEQGVRIFRVDNPHTKPLPFWEWLISEVRTRHPDVIFLSEAFTRPKMMYRLAKVGFSQSYTYFTWRNTKRELTDYLVELTKTEVKDYFRPHFFVNTPDINPVFLQTSGRPGFLIRAALATTLSGLWGMYSGFEFCEAAPLPGREEYLDSEKYEIRIRRQDTPGNIIAEIAKLNRIRKANPALQSHLGLRFYNAFNDQIIYYGKPSPTGEEMVLIAVSLDPHHVQEATIEVPLWEWGLPDGGSVAVEDLMRGHRFVWTGKLQQVRLDPAELPFAIWRITKTAGAR
jgi:starch synthase (maltosyl-transferring)